MKTFVLYSVLGLGLFIQRATSQKVIQYEFSKMLGPRAPSLGKRQVTSSSIQETPITNQVYFYTVDVSIGTPGQAIQMQIVTGSTDTYVFNGSSPICTQAGSSCPSASYNFQNSSTFHQIGLPFNLTFGNGLDVAGSYITDSLEIGGVSVHGLQMGLVTNGTAGVANTAQLGLGWPVDEAICTSPSCTPYPTFLDDLVAQDVIASRTYSIWLNDENAPSGTILFGGIDGSKYRAPLSTFPMQKDSSGGYSELSVNVIDLLFVGSDATTYHLVPTDNEPVPYILEADSATTYFPSAVWSTLAPLLELKNDTNGGWWTPCTNTETEFEIQVDNDNSPSLRVPIEQFLIANATQLIGNTTYCGIFIDTADNSGGLATLGEGFLRSIYSVYNLDDKTISLAPANYNVNGSDVAEIPAGAGAVASVASVLASSSFAALSASASSAAASESSAAMSAAATRTSKTAPFTTASVSTLGLSSPSALPPAAFTSMPATKGAASTLSGTGSVLLLLASITIAFVRWFG